MADPADDERSEELESLSAIYPELTRDDNDLFHATLELLVAPNPHVSVLFHPQVVHSSFCSLDEILEDLKIDNPSSIVPSSAEVVQPEWQDLKYLPPLALDISLPSEYPTSTPPVIKLSTSPDYFPASYLESLEEECTKLWDEYAHTAVLFAYVDYLQQAVEDGFTGVSGKQALKVPLTYKPQLLDFDKSTKRKKFERETFSCGICLEPKKGVNCHRLATCGHVFCRACLQDFFTASITQGDVASVKCPDPTCGRADGAITHRRAAPLKLRAIPPGELLQVPLDRTIVQRYVDLKHKKKLESDQTTVYCPRKWCQGAARSKKYPKPTSLDTYVDSDSEPEDSPTTEAEGSPTTKPTEKAADPSADRLCICEDCSFAFCRVCLNGWHGDFVRCWPRTAAELTAEESASYDFIRKNTSPCPTCSSPTQKTHGCNHMSCPQCRTHFCYLCSSWLDEGNPYEHFNNPKKECFERLWDLEEGDNADGGVAFVGQRGWEAAVEIAEREAEAAEAVGNQNGENQAGGDRQDRARDGEQEGRQGQRREELGNEERAGIQHFLEMVENDEEDGWDSDELGDEERFNLEFR
ncbi:hypothetical protein P152DRAFT_460822 [Eremomyces bilateralis CBS 781.70]|uniref:RBR-type E3 ubiquitin transferase n=1 Tax=Eremomyces bilateralis CBS 781.70 TaxID=1392243 RepID=A0A6G1FWK3_9PEZI|nr:uncharacterized protein P152DRAFT_460822 [Eremomyces bilateralis CBS 781.70]KAF1810009.1 hypothetical protein P152DRAFT_460822 [Eremomyces bilateralis CBS 781.70]